MPLPSTSQRPASQRQFLRTEAFEAIYAAINDGTLRPEEVLRDDELMRWLGMSRTPIRHALARLAESGLVEMIPGKPTRVAPTARDRVNRALFVSGILNEHTVRHVVGRLDEAQLGRVGRFAADARTAEESGDSTRLGDAVREFFLELMRAYGNGVLIEQANRFGIELARFLQPGESTVDQQAMIANISAIDAAVQAADATAAVAVTRELYALTRRNFVAEFREPEVS